MKQALSSSHCSAAESDDVPREAGPPWANQLHRLSERFLRLIRPVRVLEALRWPREVEEEFLQHQGKRLPQVGPEVYSRLALGFDPDRTRGELVELQHEIRRTLGERHPGSRLLDQRCQQAHLLLDLLQARGQRQFSSISERLYGSSRDPLPSGSCRLADLAETLGRLCTLAQGEPALQREERALTAVQAAHLLSTRLTDCFPRDFPLKVQVTDSLDASAAVGGDALKVHRNAVFSLRDVRLLEVHEGWVHLGTGLNARKQGICTFLRRSLPDSTRTQEGLAVWTEVLSFASHPARLRLLAGRVEAVALAEKGANFLEVYELFLELGLDPRESYRQTVRTFRGSVPEGGPFTKDLAYTRGFAEVARFLQDVLRQQTWDLVALLFCGKVSVTDLPALRELREQGWLRPAIFLPPPFADLRGLFAWICCVGALGVAS